MSSSTKSRQVVKFFRIEFHITSNGGTDIYGVVPLGGIDPSVARKAYRFHKRTGKERISYDVSVDPKGHVQCECKGFLRWGHCKHIKTLKAAGMLG